MDEVPGSEGRPHTQKTEALGICAKEDRRCAKSAMGKGQGSEEDGLTSWTDQQGESRPRQWLERRLPCGRRRLGRTSAA